MAFFTDAIDLRNVLKVKDHLRDPANRRVTDCGS
jgi:hypothetical protein